MSARRAKRKPRLALAVQYAVRSRTVPTRAQVRGWLKVALDHDAQITVRIVGQKEGRLLNRNYRGRNYATNVLTFVMRDTAPFEGDLVLCAPVVRREAREQGKRPVAHYAHLIAHGALHLQGYDHEHAADAKVMEKREQQVMAKLGYPDPYGSEE